MANLAMKDKALARLQEMDHYYPSNHTLMQLVRVL